MDNQQNHSLNERNDSTLHEAPSQQKKQWVKFDEVEMITKNDSNTEAQVSHISQSIPKIPHIANGNNEKASTAAILSTESVQINLDNTATSFTESNRGNPLAQPVKNESPSKQIELYSEHLGAVDLSTGPSQVNFTNGDIIVTLLPVNTKCSWVTCADFRPELVPEELMAPGLTLTVEDYVHVMETLINDYRFTLYISCYKRILVIWMVMAFSLLLGVLFSGLKPITLFCLGLAWLFFNAISIFVCMLIKNYLLRGLEKCMANINKLLFKHNILLIMDDRGKISCHKITLCFIYFDHTACVTYLNEFIEKAEAAESTFEPGWEQKLDISANDIVIQGTTTTRVSRKQDRGSNLFLRYASRWGKKVLRGTINVTNIEPARHCPSFFCPCQYIENHLKCKPRGRTILRKKQ